MPKVLLTSVCRPLGPAHGDAESVGYELLFGQVTRAQGLFSPRALHVHFSLEYIAENLDAPAVVLQYPSKDELVAELERGDYDYVGLSFIMATFHKLKDSVALIRRHAPRAKIVLGGYGTVLKDEVLAPYGDFICREEGVAYFRRLLGEPPAAMPYKHPLVVSRLKLFGLPVSKTGMIFAGLGCANGCDFCCTSHFFKRKHVKLLAGGADIYRVVERYLDLDPSMSFTVLDEDFLLNKRRALEFRDCVKKGGRAVSLFVFASIRAISQYTMEEILEMGIDGMWIGYEGTRSGYAKQQGRAPEELFPDLARHGVTVLASMIVGFDYQDREVAGRELDGLLALEPCLSQFLIYGPTPGTPFYERVMKERLLHDDLASDPELYYRSCSGFKTMIKHPRLSPAEIEGLQRWCFEEDYRRLGPSIYRVIERWLNGHETLKGSSSPTLRLKAERFARDVRKSYPAFLPGRLFGPNARARARVAALERRARAVLGPPTLSERLQSLAAVAAAAWTWLTLRVDRFQHPRLTRTPYRSPDEAWTQFPAWERLVEDLRRTGVEARLDLQHARRQVWLRVEGTLDAAGTAAVSARLARVLEACRGRVVLDLGRLSWDGGSARALREGLARHRRRLAVVLPRLQAAHPEALLAAQVFRAGFGS